MYTEDSIMQLIIVTAWPAAILHILIESSCRTQLFITWHIFLTPVLNSVKHENTFSPFTAVHVSSFTLYALNTQKKIMTLSK